MRIDTSEPNQASIALDPGETMHFSMAYLRGRDFGVPLLPPCPFGSPLVRLYHGCYWMGRHRAGPSGGDIRLTGPTVIGSFRAVGLAAGERRFVDCRHLVGFSLGAGGGIRTQLSRLLSPTMWALRHPLPVVVTGPGTVILYGEGLDEVEVSAGAEFIPAQVVSFDASRLFQARALNPDSGVLSHLSNALGRQARWVFAEPARVLITPVNRPESDASRVILHLVLHILVWILLVVALNV